MEKILKYLLGLIEWMVIYRQWYEENIHKFSTKDDDIIKKPPPPPPPH